MQETTATKKSMDFESLNAHNNVFYHSAIDKRYKIEIYNGMVFIKSAISDDDGTIIATAPLTAFKFE